MVSSGRPKLTDAEFSRQGAEESEKEASEDEVSHDKMCGKRFSECVLSLLNGG